MATRLDKEIEQLEKIVERCMNLCSATWDGIRCSLPANHEPTNSHRFPIEFLLTPSLQGIGGDWQSASAGSNYADLGSIANR